MGPQFWPLESLGRPGRLRSGHRWYAAIDRIILYVHQAILSGHPPRQHQHTPDILPRDGPKTEVTPYCKWDHPGGLHLRAPGPH